MDIRADEISRIISEQIQGHDTSTTVEETGTVLTVGDGIARVYGLSKAMAGEMLEFPGNAYGMALNLERDSVGAVVLGDYEHITEGDKVKTTGRILEVPTGEALLAEYRATGELEAEQAARALYFALGCDLVAAA